MNKDIFSLDYQFDLYLQRCGLDKSQMPPIQLQETKRAFFGACGQMLVLFRDEVSELEENEAVNQMQNLLSQTVDFWTKEANKQN